MEPSGGNHLGAAGGREVVFCHACQNEWYRDEHDSLTCPRCESSFTEIVESSNDPRNMHAPIFSNLGRGPSPLFRRSGGSDSDPDEGDVEEHLPNEQRFPYGGPSPQPQDGAHNDRGRNMNEGDVILRRFADMLMNDFGGGRTMRGGPVASGLFPPEEHVPPPGTRVQHTTFRAGPFGGRTRVTVTSGTFGGGPGAPPVAIDTLFDQLFGNPFGGGPQDPNRRDRGGPEPIFAGGLQGLLNSLYNPEAAVHGDSVYSQAAFDRIITQLMEASAQTNAAPPATQTAIDSLEKKRVDNEMLGPEGKAECTICIDEIKKGDEVSVLPCKHWYHGECVVLWLKEHNTCPICRMPIENGNGGRNSTHNNGNGQQPQQSPESQSASARASTASSGSTPSPVPGSTPSPAPGPRSAREMSYTTSTYPLGPFTFSSITARPRQERERPARSARENLDRLNAIRNLASGGSDAPRSGSHRRNSHSPPGAWPTSDAESASRARVRSPSASRDREWNRESQRGPAGWERGDFASGIGGRSVGMGGWERSPEQQQQQSQQQPHHQQDQQGSGGSGPLGWLRDHFGRRG